MQNLIENRRVSGCNSKPSQIMRDMRAKGPNLASCFDALATSVDDVSPELLEAYVEIFQKIEHRQVGRALKQSIQQGLWWPKTRQNTWSASLRLHLKQGRLPEARSGMGLRSPLYCIAHGGGRKGALTLLDWLCWRIRLALCNQTRPLAIQ